MRATSLNRDLNLYGRPGGVAMIHMIGPGGAGKSTIGKLVAQLVGSPFHDLDRLFEVSHGNIDLFIKRNGYASYVWANVETYCRIATDAVGVLAVSSGFMTYPDSSHPRLPDIRIAITKHTSTIALLPSLDLETCVAETVRRQRARPLVQHRTNAREEKVIRERFPVYQALPVRKVTTMRAPADVATAVVNILAETGLAGTGKSRGQGALFRSRTSQSTE